MITHPNAGNDDQPLELGVGWLDGESMYVSICMQRGRGYNNSENNC